LFIFSAIVSAQSGFNPIYLEYHSIPNDTAYTNFISYKISYKNLVFVKENSHYSSGLTLNIEVADSNSTLFRGSTFSDVIVDDYESTNSTDFYLEGLISFDLPKGKFKAHPFVNLNNSKRERRLTTFPIDFEKDSSGTALLPIVVYNNFEKDNDELRYRLVNFRNAIPYAIDDYDILIPIADKSIKILQVEITQDKAVKFRKGVTPKFTCPVKIEVSDGTIILSESEHGKIFNIFHLTSVSTKLDEGEANVILYNENTKFAEFNMKVEWVDKPKILNHPEVAIELVKYIDGYGALRSLRSNSDEDFYPELYKYWKKYDPNKKTGFNELMNEFYKRADYANTKFGSASQLNGSLTDRGKIYIKYGPPSKIDRVYSERNSVIESWLYEKLDMGFFFKDESGLGEFKLLQ